MTGLPGSIADAAALIRTRALSPLELARELLTRIQRFDPLLNAFLRVTETLALSQAAHAERRRSDSRRCAPHQCNLRERGRRDQWAAPDADTRYELSSGFGRTGKWFAVEHWDVVPDIMTMAKGLTSAYAPLGAVAMKPEIASKSKVRQTMCIYS